MLKLKELRNSRKISQQKLAADIGVSRSTVAMWETGGSQPDNDYLCTLAEYFHITVDYLLGMQESLDTPNQIDMDLGDEQFALWGEVRDLTESEKQDVLEFIKFKKSQRG